MSFGDKLQNLRKTKGLSQEELAEKCDVSRQAVSKWETGLGYPETEKLLILCEILETNLDYLLRDKSDTLGVGSDQEETSPYTPYVGKWVQIFLRDNEFQGFYCIAILGIRKSWLIFMDDKGKLGLLNEASVRSMSDLADNKKPKKLPDLSCQEDSNNFDSCFSGKKFVIKLTQDSFISLFGTGFTKPGGFWSVTVESASDDAVTVCDKKGCKHTVRWTDVLFMKEC